MRKFRLLPKRGTHTVKNTDGTLRVHSHDKDPIVETDEDLVAKYQNKFEEITPPKRSAKAEDAEVEAVEEEEAAEEADNEAEEGTPAGTKEKKKKVKKKKKGKEVKPAEVKAEDDEVDLEDLDEE